jgi:dsRNA-specific ribonuclease
LETELNLTAENAPLLSQALIHSSFFNECDHRFLPYDNLAQLGAFAMQAIVVHSLARERFSTEAPIVPPQLEMERAFNR